MKKNRILSLILTLTMLLSVVLPTTVLSEEYIEPTEPAVVVADYDTAISDADAEAARIAAEQAAAEEAARLAAEQAAAEEAARLAAEQAAAEEAARLAAEQAAAEEAARLAAEQAAAEEAARLAAEQAAAAEAARLAAEEAERFDAAVAIEQVTVGQLYFGETDELKANVLFANKEYTVTWESLDPRVAPEYQVWSVIAVGETLALPISAESAAMHYRVVLVAVNGRTAVSDTYRMPAPMEKPVEAPAAVIEAPAAAETVNAPAEEKTEVPAVEAVEATVENAAGETGAEAASDNAEEEANEAADSEETVKAEEEAEAAEMTEESSEEEAVEAAEESEQEAAEESEQGTAEESEQEAAEESGDEAEIIPAEEEQAEESPAEPTVTLYSELLDTGNGTNIRLTCRIEGDGQLSDVLYVWEADSGSGWQAMNESVDAIYEFPATLETLSASWRVRVVYR